MTPPIGEVTRRELQKALELLRMDNLYWITSRLNAGFWVPCCPKAAGVEYREFTDETPSHEQSFWSGPFMFEQKWGSCGDINAYKAAAMTGIYGIPTRIIVPAQGVGEYHVDYLAPWGAYDETQGYATRQCNCPRYHPSKFGAMEEVAA